MIFLFKYFAQILFTSSFQIVFCHNKILVFFFSFIAIIDVVVILVAIVGQELDIPLCKLLSK